MTRKAGKLADLIDMENPAAVLEEVHHILKLISPDLDGRKLVQVFQDVSNLFQGRYPGYRPCNTWYHDLKHTTDCFLALARLIHGATVNGLELTSRYVSLGLIAALLHDTGYIQRDDEMTGTGAQFTIIHVERSIEFMRQYFVAGGYAEEEFRFAANCLKCTGLTVNIGREVQFLNRDNEVLGKMLGVADLLGQMADRTYLEKLPFLFQEFREAGVPGFSSELELLEKTPGFWEFIQQRFASELDNLDRYMRDHFRVRWGIDQDLNRQTVETNIAYLKHVLKNSGPDYARHLRRGNLMHHFRKYYPKA
jgi:hypothetical protein